MWPWDYSGSDCFSTGAKSSTTEGMSSQMVVAIGLGGMIGIGAHKSGACRVGSVSPEDNGEA